MDAEALPEIFRPFSNVLEHQFIEIHTSGAKQPNNVSCSVVPRTMDFPIPIPFCQMVADALHFFTRGFSREFNELLKRLHRSPLVQQ